jgi:hypothetical protein
MKLNNWIIYESEVDVDLPFNTKKYYYYLMYIHKFNSVWTVELVFNLMQYKLVTPKIAEWYINNIDRLLSTWRRQAFKYEYFINLFNDDTIYFMKNYIVYNGEKIRIIDKFSYQISEESIKKIEYYLTQVL